MEMAIKEQAVALLGLLVKMRFILNVLILLIIHWSKLTITMEEAPVFIDRNQHPITFTDCYFGNNLVTNGNDGEYTNSYGELSTLAFGNIGNKPLELIPLIIIL